MPEDRNKSYDLHIDPELLKIMPKPKLGGNDTAKPRSPEPQTPDDSRIDRRSPDEIPEIDPETGEPDLPQETGSHFLDIDPELLKIMPRPMMGGGMLPPLEQIMPERELPRPSEENVTKPDTLELMATTAEQARVERERERGPLTGLGLPENITAMLAYVLGWVSGLLVLLIEKNSRFVRRHGAQSVAVFGILSLFYLMIAVVSDAAGRDDLFTLLNMLTVGTGGWFMYTAYRKRPADIPGIRSMVDAILKLL